MELEFIMGEGLELVLRVYSSTRVRINSMVATSFFLSFFLNKITIQADVNISSLYEMQGKGKKYGIGILWIILYPFFIPFLYVPIFSIFLSFILNLWTRSLD